MPIPSLKLAFSINICRGNYSTISQKFLPKTGPTGRKGSQSTLMSSPFSKNLSTLPGGPVISKSLSHLPRPAKRVSRWARRTPGGVGQHFDFVHRHAGGKGSGGGKVAHGVLLGVYVTPLLYHNAAGEYSGTVAVHQQKRM
jgi:hypothetical protein